MTKLIAIESNVGQAWINPEQVVSVRPSGEGEGAGRTRIGFVNGEFMFVRLMPVEVAAMVNWGLDFPNDRSG
jgi:hypothetical protein